MNARSIRVAFRPVGGIENAILNERAGPAPLGVRSGFGSVKTIWKSPPDGRRVRAVDLVGTLVSRREDRAEPQTYVRWTFRLRRTETRPMTSGSAVAELCAPPRGRPRSRFIDGGYPEFYLGQPSAPSPVRTAAS